MNQQFEHFCHLIVCRQEANLKRRRLLYHLAKAERLNGPRHFHGYVLSDLTDKQRHAYRNHANMMRLIAKTIYSPLRRQLKISTDYDANNAIKRIVHEGVEYSYTRIKELAVGYQFDNVVLRDGYVPSNPYLGDK